MRWFKHLSMAHSDHAVSAILEELGAEAYGVWWLILEDIAASIEKNSKDTFAIHSDVKWSQICYCSARKFRSIANRLQEKGLIVCTSTDNRLKIDVPKLLKFRDEYSKKSGHSPDSRTETDGDTDTDTEGELKPLASSAEALPAGAPSEPISFDQDSSPEPHIGTLPLVDGSQFGFTQADVSGWCEAYPAVDVMQQLREMREWCKANPKLRKTRSGIRRYITTWLGKEQDRGGNRGTYQSNQSRGNLRVEQQLEELRKAGVTIPSGRPEAGPEQDEPFAGRGDGFGAPGVVLEGVR